VFCTFCIRILLCATTACTFSTSQFLPVLRSWRALFILTSKCALRHTGVHFFDISTSKSGANMWCFVHFDLEMCFVPQRRALFRHLNCQKWSEPGVFCTFWLGNVLRAISSVHIVGSLTSKLSSIRVPNFYNGMAAHHKNQVFGPYPIHSPIHHSLCNTDPNNVVVQFIQFCWLCITPCTFCSDPQSTARWKEF